jgi:type IV secretion system protein VirB4
MAEFWKRLELSEFTDFAVNKQFTIRKQNGFGIFDTQSPAQILKTPHVAAMVEQCATQIFLPNPKADYHDYVEGFKVTDMEYHTIRTLGETSRQFLVKQGHTSTVVTLDLGSLNEMLDVLSTSLDNVEILDEVRAEVGDDVQDWMPILLDRLAQRKAMTKANKGRVSQ